MNLYVVKIGKWLSGDDGMIYAWRKRKVTQEYVDFLGAGEVVPMKLRPHSLGPALS